MTGTRTVGADRAYRPVVLDTGELRPAPRRRGRAVRDIAVAVVIGAGAILAGGWSVLTAAHATAPAGRPAPLWFPASPPAPNAGPAPATSPAPR